MLDFAQKNPTPRDARHTIFGGADHLAVPPMSSEVLNVLKSEAAPFDAKLRDRALACGRPAVMPSARVVLVEADRGGMTVPVFMTPDSNALQYFELSIDQPGEPVLVVITGYDGVAVRITRSDRTNLAAVHVHTYYPSVVLGVDAGRVTRQYLPRTQNGCTYGFSDAVKGPAVIQKLGIDTDKVLRYTTRSIKGHELAIGAPQATRRDPPRLGSFLDPEMPASHSYGILALHHLGYIRPTKLASRVGVSGYGFPYEVLKPFRMPEGLAGGHSVIFVVPESAAAPSGELAHSSIVQPIR